MSISPTPRLNLSAVAPDGYASMQAFAQTVETAARKAGIEPEILFLVPMRASQVNGCAYPSVPRSCEAGLEPETLSLRASLEFISREFAQPGT